MPEEHECLECGGPADTGCTVHGGRVCPPCWQLLLKTATSKLCDRIIESSGTGGLHPVVVSRVVATALTEPVDRLRVLFELNARGLGSNQAAGRRSDRLLALVRGLAANTAPRRTTPGRISSGFWAICSTCHQNRYIVGRKDEDSLCGACWVADERVQRPCLRCGQHDRLSWARLCRKCRGHDKIRSLFTDQRLEARPTLRMVRDQLLAAEGSYVHYMTKGRSWSVLSRLVVDERDITHEALDELLQPGAGMLRSFLVSTGVLPERDERLHSFELWIQRKSASITHMADRRAFTAFARWRHLRKARAREMTTAQIAGYRRELAQVRNLLDMLHSQRQSLSDLDQQTLDNWQSQGPFERWLVRPFLQWCRRNGVCRALVLYTPPVPPLPEVFRVSEADRTLALKRILDPEENSHSGLRLAAGLVIIYGFRSHTIARLQVADVVDTGTGVWIRLGPEPLQLPKELEEHARAAVRDRIVTRFGGKAEDSRWLFPGPFQDRPVGPDALRDRLRTVGVKPDEYRSAALGRIAQQLPSPVLSRLTGLTPITAVRWTSAVSASYARNLPGSGPGSIDQHPRVLAGPLDQR